MTPWWASLVGVAVGAILGGGLSFLTAKHTQDRTDRREMYRLKVEAARDQRKIDSEKPSRLRPNRIEMVFEVGKFIHELEMKLEVLDTRVEHDDRDLDAVAGECGAKKYDAIELGVRFRLLFPTVEPVWSEFEVGLEKLDTLVEHGDQMTETKVSMLKLGEPQAVLDQHERERWSLITSQAYTVLEAIAGVSNMLKQLMRQIDTE